MATVRRAGGDIFHDFSMYVLLVTNPLISSKKSFVHYNKIRKWFSDDYHRSLTGAST